MLKPEIVMGSNAGSGPEPPVGRSRFHTWLGPTVAVASALIFALGLIELTLRVARLAPSGGVHTVDEREFARIPGLFSPGQHLVDRGVEEIPYQVTIDSLGYRGRSEIQRSKPEGEVRILMLGDSFTYGDLVDDDETLPSQVERLLQQQCGGTVRIINAGVGGSGIITATAMAERAAGLGIDIAVLTFNENDVTDLVHPLWNRIASNRAAKSRFPMSIVYPVVRELALWNLLLKAQSAWGNRGRTARVPTPLRNQGASSGDSALVALREQYGRRLGALHDTLAAVGIGMIFVVYPSHLSVYGIGFGEQVGWATEMGAGEGLQTVDLTVALRSDGRSQEELYLLPVDGHPSPAGYSVVAPVLADAMLKTPPLFERCTAPSGG